VNTSRYCDASWVGQRLQSGRDIDTIAIDPPLIRNDLTLIDADAKLEPALGIYGNVALGDHRLKSDRAANGPHGAGKLGKKAISCRVENLSHMVRHKRQNGRIVALKSMDRALFVLADETTVTSNVGGQNGGEAAIHCSHTSCAGGIRAQCAV
jgi:hypothetical protein